MSRSKTAGNRKRAEEQVEEPMARAQFNVDQVVVDKNRTSFVLNMAKDNCNQIVFDFNDRADLKGLLFTIFESGKPFDFQIAEKLGKGLCKINGIRRAWSGVLGEEESELAGTDERARASGLKSYSVFLVSQRAYHTNDYFRIEKPAKSDNLAWVWARQRHPSDAMMRDAFGRGKQIRIWVGNASAHPAFDGDLVARVYQSQIEFE